MTRIETIDRLKAMLPELQAQYGVRRIGVFGSVARNDAGPESDIDLVAEFAPDATAGVFELLALERELSRRLGRPTTIAALSQMNAYVRASAERDLVYAE